MIIKVTGKFIKDILERINFRMNEILVNYTSIKLEKKRM